jgi:hypothetical protein
MGGNVPAVESNVWPWPAGAATGIGSLPGTDIVGALRLVLDELPDLAYLPELPARGPGADMVGRAAGLLVDMPVELHAGRWRIASRPGLDARRTRDLLERDLDALTEVAAGYTGTFKVQAAGAWTLAAAIELPIGGKLLRDTGAVRDLAASAAEGLRGYAARVAARLPGARILLQIDEPSLPAVLAGRVPTERVPVVVHCCAPGVPVGLIHAAGAAGIAMDLTLGGDLDALGEALDAGLGLFAGALDTTAPGPRRPVPTSVEVASLVRELWCKVGFPLAGLPDQVVVTPACGLAGVTSEHARVALAACRDAAIRLRDEAAG